MVDAATGATDRASEDAAVGEIPATADVTDAASTRTAGRRAARRRLRAGPEAYGLPVSLLVLVVVLLVIDRPALIREWETWRNIASSSAIGVVVASALVIPLRAGEFNLSIGASVAGSAVATAAGFVTYGLQLWLAIAIGIAIGTLIGTVAGAVTGYGRVNSLIATLGLGILVQGLVEWYTPTSGLSALRATPLTDLFNDDLPGLRLPPAVPIALLVAGVAYYLLDHLPFGRDLTAIGSNRTAATLVGVRVPRKVFAAFVVSGLISGIGGVLVLGSLGSVSAQTAAGAGVGYWLPALAAAYFGATAFQPGRFNIAGAVIATVAVKLVRALFSLANVTEAWPENVVNGTALILALAAAGYLARRRGTVQT